MSHSATLQNLVQTNKLSAALTRGSVAKTEIKALQNALYEVGYGKELNWEKYGADGGYGGSTVAAMTEFMKRNNLSGSPETVSPEIATRLLELNTLVSDVRQLKELLDAGTVETTLTRGSNTREPISALQTVLNAQGFGAELNWAKYGADGGYGASTVAAITAFAAREQLAIATPDTVTPALLEAIIGKYVSGMGDTWLADAGSRYETAGAGLQIAAKTIKGNKYYDVTDGQFGVRFRGFRKGVYTFGGQSVVDFIAKNKTILQDLDITESAMNVMIAVSENEGNLDAINTWDNSFMTFGMFQWTIGAVNDEGELPAMLRKVKIAFPEKWQQFYGRYGLDIAPDTGEVYGFLTYKGKKVKLVAEKEMFRTNEWSYIFWRAGQDTDIQAIEIEHALSRLKSFYWKTDIFGFKLSDIITSEYGVGLILDNHVNRPGYVKPCVQKAMEETGLKDPRKWSTADELKVVEAYVRIRAAYGSSPMTHANNRAAVTKKYLNNGIISKERNSFQFSAIASRSANTIGVAVPMEYAQEEYPTIHSLYDDEFAAH